MIPSGASVPARPGLSCVHVCSRLCGAQHRAWDEAGTLCLVVCELWLLSACFCDSWLASWHLPKLTKSTETSLSKEPQNDVLNSGHISSPRFWVASSRFLEGSRMPLCMLILCYLAWHSDLISVLAFTWRSLPEMHISRIPHSYILKPNLETWHLILAFLEYVQFTCVKRTCHIILHHSWLNTHRRNN